MFSFYVFASMSLRGVARVSRRLNVLAPRPTPDPKSQDISLCRAHRSEAVRHWLPFQQLVCQQHKFWCSV